MKIKLRNRLEVLMKDSGINTFEEMAQRLTQNQDWKIGRTSLSRKFRDDDVSLTLKMIEAICNELQCLPGDIFETDIYDASDEFLEGVQSRLQPFRYGAIRVRKAGADSSVAPHSDNINTSVASQTNKPPGKVKSAVDLDLLIGPKVSHLHHDKLKKK